MYTAVLAMGDKPFQERHAVTRTHACTCRKAFRSVKNHTCKSNFWLHVFTTNCLSLIKICTYYHDTIKQVAVVDLNWSYVHNYFDCENYCWFHKKSKSPHYNKGRGLNLKICQNFVGTNFFLKFVCVVGINLYGESWNFMGGVIFVTAVSLLHFFRNNQIPRKLKSFFQEFLQEM